MLKDSLTGKFVTSLTDEERIVHRKRSVARYNKKRREGNTGAMTQREWNLFYKYGLTENDFIDIVKSQDGGCAICGKILNLSLGRDVKCRFHVDHDHATGRVRGVLCYQCNVGLGNFRDNIEFLLDAAAYLERAKSESQ